ncbi:YcaO-like family protein [Rhizobium azibense]|uniref:Ribosomal protein S12 methylthiotransferase accessory factor n=1 Tax=Rhizobium azibense TaxID=1136135 RepID=A0A4R3RF10_9HYPH|nr:YcaO-like family protein [Rhizobium azibense]TCU33134.1 ribosomal protein S12 methylthiotransferase accessory factor [Rhizobium azibense]
MRSAHCDIEQAFHRLQAFRTSMTAGLEPVPRRLTRDDLEPVLGSFGITRVADITDLDVIGIPVCSGVRPASRSLSVSSGKGMTFEAAWVSTVMESCEQALAEDAPALTAIVDSPQGLARRGLRSVPLDRQSRCATRHLPPDKELAWVRGMSWLTGEAVYAPYELVGMDMVTLAPWNTLGFRMSSVGLASGGDIATAFTHALGELIEDDALFGTVLAPTGRRAGCVEFIAGEDDELVQAMSRLATAGIEARFSIAGDDSAMPVVTAVLLPQEDGTRERLYFSGSGCGPRLEDAALAALLEAVQCRALFISGARDDLFEGEYRGVAGTGTERLFGACRFLPPGDQTDHRMLALNDTVGVVAEGGRDIYVFPLGGGGFGFEAVRVLADDLVSMTRPASYVPSGRAARKLLRQWSLP